MHGDDRARLQQATGIGRLFWAHGEVITNRKHDDIRRIKLADNFHVTENVGVASVVDPHAVGKFDHVTAGFAAVNDLVAIFNDVDKEDYPRVFRIALSKLRKGGLFITDNVLWSGRAAQKDASEATTQAIQELNRLLYASPDLFTTILPLRDGLAVAMKK